MSLLVATDLSTRSAAALRYAEHLASVLNERLSVIHVAPKTRQGISKDAAHALDLFLREYAEDLQSLEATTRVGEVNDMLIEASTDHTAIVCGATGSSYLDDIFLGSTASRLIRESVRPVVVVPHGFSPHINSILLAMGFDSASRAALSLAEDLATASGASICILVAAEEDATDEEVEELHARAEALTADREEFRPTVLVKRGHPATVIRDTVEEEGSDLVVMGTHARQDEARFFLGSVAEQVVRNPPCPVVTVRPFDA